MKRLQLPVPGSMVEVRNRLQDFVRRNRLSDVSSADSQSQSIAGLNGHTMLYLSVFTQLRTQNRCAALREPALAGSASQGTAGELGDAGDDLLR
jgi:hypothetical protein